MLAVGTDSLVNETRSTLGSLRQQRPHARGRRRARVRQPWPARRPPAVVASAGSAACGVRRSASARRRRRPPGPGAIFHRYLQQRAASTGRPKANTPIGRGHDAADHVRRCRCRPIRPGVLGGDPAVVPEDRDDVGDVVLALDQPLAGVRATPAAATCAASRSSRSATRSRRSPRSRAEVRGHGPSWKARWAAAMAAAVSSAPASSTSATRLPSAGHRMVRRPPASALTHDPST